MSFSQVALLPGLAEEDGRRGPRDRSLAGIVGYRYTGPLWEFQSWNLQTVLIIITKES